MVHFSHFKILHLTLAKIIVVIKIIKLKILLCFWKVRTWGGGYKTFVLLFLRRFGAWIKLGAQVDLLGIWMGGGGGWGGLIVFFKKIIELVGREVTYEIIETQGKISMHFWVSPYIFFLCTTMFTLNCTLHPMFGQNKRCSSLFGTLYGYLSNISWIFYIPND